MFNKEVYNWETKGDFVRDWESEGYFSISLGKCAADAYEVLGESLRQLEEARHLLGESNPKFHACSLLYFLRDKSEALSPFFTHKNAPLSVKEIKLAETSGSRLSYGDHFDGVEQKYGLFYFNDSIEKPELMSLQLIESLSSGKDKEIIRKFGQISKKDVVVKLMETIKPYAVTLGS